MDINCVDNRGSTPLHWACYSKSEFALQYILALKPDINAQDNLGFTPLHLAVRSVGSDEKNTTKPVRSLLLKGAKRSIKNQNGQLAKDLMKEKLCETTEQDLNNILEEPRYVECCMTKTPLVQLRKNHKTQLLFLSLFIILVFSQIFIIVPSK